MGVAAVAICLWAYGRVTPDSSAQVPRHDPSGASQRDVAAHTGEPLKTTLDLYDLDHPTFKDKLPGKLEEVSGVTAVSASAVACVQDEDGCIMRGSTPGPSSGVRWSCSMPTNFSVTANS